MFFLLGHSRRELSCLIFEGRNSFASSDKPHFVVIYYIHIITQYVIYYPLLLSHSYILGCCSALVSPGPDAKWQKQALPSQNLPKLLKLTNPRPPWLALPVSSHRNHSAGSCRCLPLAVAASQPICCLPWWPEGCGRLPSLWNSE